MFESFESSIASDAQIYTDGNAIFAYFPIVIAGHKIVNLLTVTVNS